MLLLDYAQSQIKSVVIKMFSIDSQKLRELMFERKVNISGLATKANLQPATVARLIKNGAVANAETIGKLADALKCDGEELLKEM